MKTIRAYSLWFAVAGLALLWGTSVVLAQSYDLSWWTVEGGGTSSGGSYQVTGVAGQMDAGVSSNGNFTLTGGFMAATDTAADLSDLYLPAIEGD